MYSVSRYIGSRYINLMYQLSPPLCVFIHSDQTMHEPQTFTYTCEHHLMRYSIVNWKLRGLTSAKWFLDQRLTLDTSTVTDTCTRACPLALASISDTTLGALCCFVCGRLRTLAARTHRWRRGRSPTSIAQAPRLRERLSAANGNCRGRDA